MPVAPSPHRPCKSTIALLGLLLSLAAGPGQAQYPDQAVILLYHHVSTQTPPSTSLSPALFQQHLDYLAENDFQVLPLEQVIEALQSGGTLPDKSIVITFDDGYASVYSAAFPMLKEKQWPFTVFVNSERVGSNPNLYSNWAQLREMAEHGATIANHSTDHNYMTNREPGESESEWLDRVRRSITEAEAVITRETGHNFKYLAYPYGEYNAEIQAMVEEMGYVGIGQHSGAVNASADFTALPRFPFAGIYASMESFPLRVNTLAFNLAGLSPADSITDSPNPSAELILAPGPYQMQQVGCFHNSQPLNITHSQGPGENTTLQISGEVESHSRRFRYNCTAPGGDGRFFWFSIPWLNPDIPE